ncbi:hypothetical protein [Acinetobacter tandoii]|uniref:Uncharacterized protein n=1 Tax=Acinetobacter tandoii DSM 14970 = CIP 107469 TaxID=1120927 RepID=R9B1D0_9GAMM|nr:hypothetical protein [Acinetobacter tandoii]EOR08238.1 hypothetical protein I593_01593 [Acinetobacter tandoii DSM 14970 = CIP 107469]
MCKDSLMQINAAIEILGNAKVGPELVAAQSQALAFIQSAFDVEEINQVEKQTLEKKVRRIYRNQLIEEST